MCGFKSIQFRVYIANPLSVFTSSCRHMLLCNHRMTEMMEDGHDTDGDQQATSEDFASNITHDPVCAFCFLRCFAYTSSEFSLFMTGQAWL